jgi:tetratricopeptide (TPR) repeat protein
MARKPKRKPASKLPIVALLIILNLIVFAQVSSHPFLNYDDGQFISENAHVLQGLTGDSISWALTSTSIGWYPITWLSHMLDVDLWQQQAGRHLMTNVVLHIISTLLLFFAFLRMTDAAWPSAVVGALFAIHPAHVESVAWASERKDTLSTLFAMLALFFYASAPQKRLRVFLAMALSIMAKQMYITLPFILLLIDFWPLRRMTDLRARVMEKLPLFGLTIFGAIMAVIGQRNLSAMQTVEAVPLAMRLSNAAVAYLRYIGKFFIPVKLAVLYPMEAIAPGVGIGAAILLVAISIAVFRNRTAAPYFFTGWFWFLGTLVPVIGIVQIGTQSIADRYTYFSFVGLSIAAVWSAMQLRIPARVLATVAAVIVLIFAALGYRQVGYWRSSEALFEHTIDITPPNALAEYSLGQTLEMTAPDRALNHLRRAIQLVESARGGSPMWHAQAYVGAGTALMMKARPLPIGGERSALIEEAVAQFEHALRLDKDAPHARNNIALAQQWLSVNPAAPQSPGSTGAPPRH